MKKILAKLAVYVKTMSVCCMVNVYYIHLNINSFKIKNGFEKLMVLNKYY